MLKNDDNIQIKNEALKLIPANVKVAASYSLVPHLSHRKEIYMFPNPFKQNLWGQWFQEGKDLPRAFEHVDYIAIDWSNHDRTDQEIIRFLKASPDFITIFDENPILVMKKTESPKLPGRGVNYSSIRSGLLRSLYLPGNKFDLRDIYGNSLPFAPNVPINLFGYFYNPETDRVRFEIDAQGDYQLTVDGKKVLGEIMLGQGFHSFAFRYYNLRPDHGLKIVLAPLHSLPYIITDNYLFLKKDPVAFAQLAAQEQSKKSAREKYMRSMPNLVVNGGFEKVIGDIPDKWRIDCWQEKDAICKYSANEKIRKSGRYAAMISQAGKADSRWVQEVAVRPRTRYKLSGWIKTADIPREGAGASLQVDLPNTHSEVLYGDNDWKYVELELKTRTGQKSFKVLCRLGDYGAVNTGTAYFDDIELKEISSDGNLKK